jgi:hypothetical protein
MFAKPHDLADIGCDLDVGQTPEIGEAHHEGRPRPLAISRVFFA